MSPRWWSAIAASRAHRLALGLWLLFGAVLWNVLLESGVRAGMDEYLRRQSRAEQGLGPRVTIDEVMDPAVAESVTSATLWTAVLVVPALTLVVTDAWRLHRSLRGDRP